MKPMLVLLTIFLIIASLTMPVQPAWSQGKKPKGGANTAPLLESKTKLEIKEFSGDFERWVQTLTINSPQSVTFRYSTNEAAAASAVWQVSDTPFSSGPTATAAEAPHVIASGVLGSVPPQGQVKWFNINFAQFVPKTPPKTPRSYWVFVVTKNGLNQPVGLPSAAVRIDYQAPSQPPTDFSGIPPDVPKPMPIVINLHSFIVNETNEGEGDDDPYLYVVAVYADGTTFKPFDPAHSFVRLESPFKTHNNLGMDAYKHEPRSGESYSIPSSVGRFEKGILPLPGLLSSQAAMNLSQVAILVAVMEEDGTKTSAANAGRRALVNNLRSELNAAVQSLRSPDIPAIKQRLTDKVKEAVKKETLSDWWAPWGLFDAFDPDDIIGTGHATFTYAQIMNAGVSGLPISLECRSDEGSYTIKGSIRKK